MKVKCKICGKVGLLNDKKSLNRHMRLAHGISSCTDKFEPTDEDAVVEILPTTKKAFRKHLNEKANQKRNPEKKKLKKNNRKHQSIYWGSVLKSGFETKK